ncbi:CHAD domain-containing protein [Microbaculum sp. FT89]|uniref:CHAD domain-containing protein n=1 Tax=Microbaculum sp. FT89 TaxID=3447298 RepID=UPI003F538F77
MRQRSGARIECRRGVGRPETTTVGHALKARVDVARTVGSDVRGVMDELLQDAVALLSSRKCNVHEAVHDARKNLKAFRSYLRLLRSLIGEDYRALNVQARDAARTLSGARDSVALHDAIDQVEAYFAHRRIRPDITALRNAADAESREAASDDVIRAASRDVAKLLKPCRETVRAWKLPDDADPYVDGLTATYKSARRLLQLGLDTRLPVDLHEARKRVIHWRYQMDLFTSLWPRVLKATVRELQDLREDLGQHNDLVLLESRIRAAEGGFEGLESPEPFLDSITVLRARRVHWALYRQALLFCDHPSVVSDHLTTWWKAARSRKHAP